jgi:hypothetical protein
VHPEKEPSKGSVLTGIVANCQIRNTEAVVLAYLRACENSIRNRFRNEGKKREDGDHERRAASGTHVIEVVETERCIVSVKLHPESDDFRVFDESIERESGPATWASLHECCPDTDHLCIRAGDGG